MKSVKIHNIIATIVVLGASFAHAQRPTPSIAPQQSPAYERAAEGLRDAPPKKYEFSKSYLSDVFRMLAVDAGISFFSLPDETGQSSQLVTFTITASPFTALETLANANGVALIYDKGVWYLRPSDDKELVGRTYQVRYNPQEVVTKNGGSSGGGASSGGGGGGVPTTGIDLQGYQDMFEVEPSAIIEDIKSLLDIPTTGIAANLAGDFSVGNLQSAALIPQQLAVNAKQAAPTEEASPIGAKAIWNPDSNTIYVVATRQQHQWVEGYLASADRPQPLIAVEIKFFETAKDPRHQLGIDWSGVLDGQRIGLGDRLSGGADSEGGNDSLGEFLSSPLNLDRIGDFTAPMTAVLNTDQLDIRLHALVNDQNTTTVSYPRVLTMNNREVVIRSVVNQPVLASSSSTSVGAGATETSQVSYLPIGTVINVLPKRMADNRIQLNVAITVSSIVGEQVIDGNPYPIASSRVYTAPLQVKSGYTVAIGGLDEAVETKSEKGIVGLRHIPILGYAFKKKGKQHTRKNLMMFITPTIMKDHSGPGLPATPVSELPQVPHIAKPVMPQFDSEGEVANSTDNRLRAIHFFNHELDILEAVTSEKRTDGEEMEKLQSINHSSRNMISQIKAQQSAGYGSQETHLAQRTAIEDICSRSRRLMNEGRWQQ